jgi:hypothetical protein
MSFLIKFIVVINQSLQIICYMIRCTISVEASETHCEKCWLKFNYNNCGTDILRD